MNAGPGPRSHKGEDRHKVGLDSFPSNEKDASLGKDPSLTYVNLYLQVSLNTKATVIAPQTKEFG